MKLGLGTAQFGLAYGISGPGIRVPASEVQAILRLARARGVVLLDTAPVYGDSEAVLGQCLTASDTFDIVTKTVAVGGERGDTSNIAHVEAAFDASLERLGRASVYGVLVHRAEDMLAADGDRLLDLLMRWQAEGRVRKIGVSVYTRAQILALFERHVYDIVQVPVSIFDQRLVVDGTLDLLKSMKVELHARSVLLQGLAVMEPAAVPRPLDPARALVERFQRTVSDWGLSPIAGALRYVAGIPAIDRVVLGVHSATQLEECLRALEEPGPPHDYAPFACTNEAIIDPRQWSTT